MKQFKALFQDPDGKLSIGRIMLWITFAVLLWYWIKAGLIVDVNVTIPDAPDSLTYTFLYLLAYGMGKKIKSVWSKGKKDISVE